MANPKAILSIAISKIDSPKEEKMECALVELLEKVFTTRNLIHFAHLTTGSFAAHMALGELYEAIVEEVDDIAETYIGTFGPLSGLETCEAKMPTDIVSYIQAEMDWIKQNRSAIGNGSTAIENLVDDLIGKYSRTLYKLKQLK